MPGDSMRAQVVPMLVLALAASCADAQEVTEGSGRTSTADDDDAEPRELERVIVTARRRDEPLQDVPLSVTAIDGKDLEMRGAEDLSAIGAATPNLTIYPARAFNGTVTAYIRGIGQFDPVWGIEPGVAIYVDDVYLARPQGALLEILDVERIEVLRGPQGTLYGKNNIGGAIKYVTRKVEDEVGGNVVLTAGSHDRRDVKAMFNAPIGERVRTRVAVGDFNRDGFGKNLVTGEDVSDRDVGVGRAMLEWRPGDFVDVRLAYDWYRDRSAPDGAQRLLVSRFDPARTPPDPGRFDVRSNAPNQDWVDSEGISATIDWELDPRWRLRSITARRETDTRGAVDFDLLPITVSTLGRYFQDEQTTQEFQALWNGTATQGVLGLFWFDGTAGGQGYGNDFDVAYDVTQGSVGTRSIALYGDLDWRFATRWRLESGLRYTHERKTAIVQNFGVTDATFQVPTGVVRANFKDSTNFDGWSPRIALSYAPTEDAMLYVQASRGFKSGTYNIRANTVAVPSSRFLIDDETVTSFEFGAKTQWRDGDVTLNGALFHNDYQDIQLSVFTYFDGDGDGDEDEFIVDFRNAGAGTIQGAEVEFAARTGPYLRWLANVGYLDTRYDTFITFGADAAATQRFTNAPPWTAGASVILEWPLRGGSRVDARIDGHYQGKTYPTANLDERIAQDGYALWNAMLAWHSPRGTWQVALSSQNLFDEAYSTNGFSIPPISILSRYYGPPRTTALSVTWSF